MKVTRRMPPVSKNLIAQLRKEKGLSQQQLADKIGSHWITISKLERGKMKTTFEWAQKIANALSVDVYQIFRQNALTPYQIELAGTISPNGVLVPAGFGQSSVMINYNFLSGLDDYWYAVFSDAFYPVLHNGDIVRMTSAFGSNNEILVGRLCLAKTAEGDCFGLLRAGLRPGTFDVTQANGVVIASSVKEVLSCVTLAILSPHELGLAELSQVET